jgi:hypothetical protein
MSELVLRRQTKDTLKDKYRDYRPQGSIISTKSNRIITRKWIEIICDLASPQKRDTYINLNIPGFIEVVENWTPALRKRWLDYDRETLDTETTQDFWDTDIKSGGLLGAIPDYRGKKAYEQWLYSDTELIHFFVVENDDGEDEEIEDWSRRKETNDRGSIIFSPQKSVDYKNKLLLTKREKDDLEDITKMVLPERNRKARKNIIDNVNPLTREVIIAR